jgi:hypothetical protein
METLRSQVLTVSPTYAVRGGCTDCGTCGTGGAGGGAIGAIGCCGGWTTVTGAVCSPTYCDLPNPKIM